MKKVALSGCVCADVIIRPFEKVPPLGQLAHVQSISLHTGGNVSNIAMNLKKLGFEAMLCTKIGRDSFGDFIKNQWEEHGIDTSYVIVDPDFETIVTAVCVAENAQRAFVCNSKEGQNIASGEISKEMIDKADLVFMADMYAYEPFLGRDIAPYFRYAKEQGKTTIADVMWCDAPDWMAHIEPILPYLDYFLPNNDEVYQLTGLTDMAQAAELFADKGVKNVIIKMGAEGSLLRKQDGTLVKTPIFPVQAVDSTGAGDAFCSGFMAGLMLELPLEECCRLGSAVGACCVEKISTTAGVRSMEETIAFMRGRENV